MMYIHEVVAQQVPNYIFSDLWTHLLLIHQQTPAAQPSNLPTCMSMLHGVQGPFEQPSFASKSQKNEK